jgi:hypothetical protein
MMGELFRNDYYVAVWRPGEPFLRVQRTHKAFAEIADAERAYDEVVRALRNQGPRRILLDLREGPPGRNDQAFEEAASSWRRQLGKLFDRRSVLVKSAAGKLQARRLNRGADNLLVTQDEAEAVRFLS